MEEGIVFDIQRFSLHDGPGIRTTVFLKGCPLRCAWCHNPESWKKEPEWIRRNGVAQLCGKKMSVEAVMEEVMADAVYYRNSGGGLTVSGGEPMLQFDFLRGLLSAAKENGLHTCIETSGYAQSERFAEILPLVDFILFDIKLTDSDSYRRWTGADNRLILQNLELLDKFGANILLRCPVIPGINDTDSHIYTIAQLLQEYPNCRGVEIMPYHDMGKGKWKELGKAYSLAQLKTLDQEEKNTLLERFRKAGCRNVSIG